MSIGRPSVDLIDRNITQVSIPGVVILWFSYETIVAFETPYDRKVVSENIWSRTTAKHLNMIDGGNKRNRVNNDSFLQMLNEYLNACQAFAPPSKRKIEGILSLARRGAARKVESA